MERPSETFFTRHGAAKYGPYSEIRGSENPQASFDPENQGLSDLTEKGVVLAQEKAEKLLAQLDPETDALFFVSSDEARALETANIYRQAAQGKGFEIIKPEKTGTEVADKIGEGGVRVVKHLSLDPKNVLLNSVFLPTGGVGDVNVEALDTETRQKWGEARKIIESDDQRSYGGNLHKHSVAINKIFPALRTSEELYEKRFKSLVRLVQWGAEKAQESGHSKSIKIMAFGHENYMMHMLDKAFHESGIGNCETMKVRVEGDNVVGEFRGKEAEL